MQSLQENENKHVLSKHKDLSFAVSKNLQADLFDSFPSIFSSPPLWRSLPISSSLRWQQKSTAYWRPSEEVRGSAAQLRRKPPQGCSDGRALQEREEKAAWKSPMDDKPVWLPCSYPLTLPAWATGCFLLSFLIQNTIRALHGVAALPTERGHRWGAVGQQA